MDTFIQEFECFANSNKEMKYDSNLKKEIPYSWTSIQINKIAEIDSGYPFSSDSYNENGRFKLITIKNVQDSGIDVNTGDRIQEMPNDLPSYCKLKPKDILLSLTGNVGRVGLMFDNDCLLNQRVAIVRPLDESLRPYLFCLFKSDTLRIKMERASGGTSQKNLSPIETEKLFIPYNDELSHDFSKRMTPIIDKMVTSLNENLRLSKLRDELLPLLINGQVSIT